MARLTVVVSQAQGRNPEKRQLEEDIITQLMFAKGIDVLVVPHFYDLTADSTAMLAMQGITGNAVVCSWMFPRAAHWLMDRNGLRGKFGSVLLSSEVSDEDDVEDDPSASETARVLDARPLPDRYLYHLDLRSSKTAQAFIDEIFRIQSETSVKVVSLGLSGSNSNKKLPSQQRERQVPVMVGLSSAGVVSDFGEPAEQWSPLTNTNSISEAAKARFARPTNDTALPVGPLTDLLVAEPSQNNSDDAVKVERLTDSAAKRRWYPVIDYSRCTNCMECIDFCLFGVYGVDTVDTILVDQPDNCRKGCPACSRVCPENAIMFPQHKTPAIAGSADDAAGFKIDLSKLFGAPDDGKTAEEVAARERDEQLMLSGRQPLGMSGIKRRSNAANEKDELDQLIDQLDELDV